MRKAEQCINFTGCTGTLLDHSISLEEPRQIKRDTQGKRFLMCSTFGKNWAVSFCGCLFSRKYGFGLAEGMILLSNSIEFVQLLKK